MKPTICRCCGEPMPVQTEGNVNMCESCKGLDSFSESLVVMNRMRSEINACRDTMQTALNCIDAENYHLAHVVLRYQLEKLNYENKGS